jgi:pilus assembly protein Flp/PilA
MSVLFRKLVRDESGATAIEYGLIVTLISTAAIGAFTVVGSSVSTGMNNVAAKL